MYIIICFFFFLKKKRFTSIFKWIDKRGDILRISRIKNNTRKTIKIINLSFKIDEQRAYGRTERYYLALR